MTKYVYMVRQSWYDEYHVFGIYDNIEDAHSALCDSVEDHVKSGLYIYKWKNKSAVDEYCHDSVTNEDIQISEYKIIKVPLNKWTEKPEGWKDE